MLLLTRIAREWRSPFINLLARFFDLFRRPNRKRWAKWWKELKRIADEQGYPHATDGYEEAWEAYYERGCTPEEAWWQDNNEFCGP